MAEKLQVYRSERKYMLSLSTALLVQEELAKLLEPDPYSRDGSYTVRSLYFDSIDDNDFYEKDAGVRYRKKIRLRVYGPDDKKAKLELKAKDGDAQHKESLIVTRQEAAYLQEGDYSFLLDKGDDLSLRLYTIMTLGVYRPVALIEYDRRAFVYQEFNTRITFDTRVRTSEFDMDVFEKNPAFVNVLEDEVVLEVKYDGKLFKPISGLLKKYNITNTSYSKYGSGRLYID